MKQLLILMLLLFILGCAEETSKERNLEEFLAPDAAVVLKLPDPDLFYSNLRNNDLVRTNLSHPFLKSVSEELGILDIFPHQSQSYLSFYRTGNGKIAYSFVTRDSGAISLDSVRNKQLETITIGGQSIQRYVIEGDTAYTGTRDDVLIISNLPSFVRKSLSGLVQPLATDPDFQQASKAATAKRPVIFLNPKKAALLLPPGKHKEVQGFLQDFSGWMALDLEITPREINFNGIALTGKGTYLEFFEDSGTQENKMASITPVSSAGFTSITFKSYALLAKNLSGENKNNISGKEAELLQITEEVGLIHGNSPVFVVRVPDPESGLLVFPPEADPIADFRGYPMYSYNGNSNFSRLFSPLLNPDSLHFYTNFENYFLFSKKKEALEEIISAVQAGRVIAEAKSFTNARDNLSSESNLLVVTRNQPLASNLAELLNPGSTEDFDFEAFPVSAFQFVSQENFAHVHGILAKTTGSDLSEAGSRLPVSIEIDAELAGPPVFFKNHRTNGMDIVVQDINNKLYLISPEGVIYWEKELEGRILGSVETVDILKNGRYQMAFVTSRKLHVIDREGNEVEPFPLEFNDPITQPLAIFDYEGSRNYRFVVTQGKELLMYDRRGRAVKGFDFKGASNEILQPPKHIRIGRKDYIIVTGASGERLILNRRGGIRVPVPESVEFSENGLFENRGDFLSSTMAGDLVRITEEGEARIEEADFAPSHHISATANHLVVLSENELMINGKSMSLDFGLYTAPRIFYVNNKFYATVTDLQASKVYLFESNGDLISGFPVYGNSPASLSDVDDDKKTELVVQGEQNQVLLYDFP